MLKTYYNEPTILFFRYRDDDQFLTVLNELEVDKLVVYSDEAPGDQFIDEEAVLDLIWRYPDFFSITRQNVFKE